MHIDFTLSWAAFVSGQHNTIETQCKGKELSITRREMYG